MGGRRSVRVRSWLVLTVPLLLTLVAAPLVGPEAVRPTARAAQAASEPVVPDGEFLYLRDCATCHGVDGEGTPQGQSLHDIGPAQAHYTISTGRMPKEKPDSDRRRRPPRYTNAEITALVDHMRRFLAPEPDIPEVDVRKGKLSEGGELYQAHCASCHQWAGSGGALLGGIESPSLKEVTPLQTAEAIRSGPVGMPTFGEEVLSDEQVNSIVRYVEYLRNPENRGGQSLWHLGPLPEGLIAWVVGMGLLILAVVWIGERE
ncbi:MAG: c-type cytochrome [Actinomycetota bacterium]|nr:c-type cytochrome [Actinomycetota bacterium]